MFVSAYLGTANGNATEAARTAGYSSPHPEGSRLLRNATVRAAIDARLESAAMGVDETLARLSDMAASDFGPFLTFTKDGEPSVDLKAMRDAGLSHLIKSIKRTRWGVSVELHDAQAALEKLGRYHSLFADRPEGAATNPILEALRGIAGRNRSAT
jgi:hypothetical protein